MTLSRQEEDLYEHMRGVGIGTDVAVDELAGFIPAALEVGLTKREVHQRVGSRISRINRKKEGVAIVPGSVAATYRLVAVD